MKFLLLAFGVFVFPLIAHAVQVHDTGGTQVKTLAEIQAELLEKIEAGEVKVNPIIMGERRRAETGVRDHYRRGTRSVKKSFRITQHYRPRYTRSVSQLYNSYRDRHTEEDREVRPARVKSRAITPYKKRRLATD